MVHTAIRYELLRYIHQLLIKLTRESLATALPSSNLESYPAVPRSYKPTRCGILFINGAFTPIILGHPQFTAAIIIAN